MGSEHQAWALLGSAVPPPCPLWGVTPCSPHHRSGPGCVTGRPEPDGHRELPGRTAVGGTHRSGDCLFFPRSGWFWLNSPPPAALPWKRDFSKRRTPTAGSGAWSRSRSGWREAAAGPLPADQPPLCWRTLQTGAVWVGGPGWAAPAALPPEPLRAKAFGFCSLRAQGSAAINPRSCGSCSAGPRDGTA